MATNDLSVALVETNSHPLGVQLVNSKRTNKFSDASDIVELASAIQKADEFTKVNVGSKLTVIAQQIQHLQEQARKILEDARRDAALHHAACNLVKKTGTIYYLYKREHGQSYLSIVSPQEWGASCPHEFLGGFRLEYDHSWTPIADLAKKDEENEFIQTIYNKHMAIAAATAGEDSLLMRKSGSQIVDVTKSVDLIK
uniref:DUF2452 domain-containing protein n=1 Tax=Arion vulgaris TaxID=1028688 RepID=A0A0B6Y9V5_9EUPU